VYDKHGEHRYEGGWNVNVLVATGIGAVSSRPQPAMKSRRPASSAENAVSISQTCHKW